MIITCEECNSSFNVSDSLIKESGSKVRCSKCDNVFVAYPQLSDDELALEADEPLPGQNENLELEDLDSALGDFLNEDKEDDEETEAPTAYSATEEIELDLDDFDNTPEPESKNALQETDGELELDLDFDQDDDSGPVLSQEEAAGDELPDLGDLEDLDDIEDIEDLGALDEAGLTEEENDSGFEDLELEMENEAGGESEDGELELEEEGGLDLTGLGLEEEDLSTLEKQPAAESEESDLGLDLELDTADQNGREDAGADLEVEDADELDLTDLELAIDNEADTAAAGKPESENSALARKAEHPLGIEDSDAGLEMEEADELDLSDFELDMEDDTVSEEASAAGSDDLDFDLDLDFESEAGADGRDAETETAESDADELDLSDLSDIMDEAAAPTADSQPDELNLELELESDGRTAEEATAMTDNSEGVDELDLSDLGDFMETGETPAKQTAAEDTVQDLELDLDLDMAESPSAADAAANAGDELDFSDLEQLLESDETPTVEAADNKNTDELELQFDLDESSGGEPAAAAGQDGEAAQEDDFLDIEQMLEEGEATTSEQPSDYAADITDLPLEMEAALDDASKGAEAELELDFDLESELQEKEDMFDRGPSDDQQLESNLLASDEVDFLEEAGIQETQFQDGPETSVVGTDDFASDELGATQGAYGATHVLPAAGDDSAAEAEEFYEEEPPLRRSGGRSKKPVLVVLLLLVLGVGVIIVPNMLGIKIPYISDIKIPYLSDLQVKIPYLSDWLNPEGQDVAGNLKLIPLGNTINGKFVANSRIGQIFVIQGEIRNDYDHPRSHIKVTGKLFQKGNKMAQKATVYCGNVLSDSELAAMDMTTIRKRLMNPAGDRRIDLKVKTGNMVPFMIVFDHLPGNLDEFSVEVAGSSI